MNSEEVLRTLPTLYTGWPDQARPIEGSAFQPVLAISGFTSLPICALLNHCCRYLLPAERYVEVGTLNGTSLIAALLNNSALAIAVDNFSEFGGSLATLENNLRQWNMLHRVEIASLESLAFWRVAYQSLSETTVGVLFYDGGHDAETTYQNLAQAERYLSDDALIIIDDWNWQAPRQATERFVLERPETARIVWAHETPEQANKHPIWWNGLALVQYQRQAGAVLIAPETVKRNAKYQRRERLSIEDERKRKE